MRIINDHLLTSTEKTLINDVLNFRFLSRLFYFDSLAGSLEIEIDPRKKTRVGDPIDRQEIEDALIQAEVELEKAWEDFNKDRNSVPSSKEYRAAEEKLGRARSRVDKLREYLNGSNGSFIVPEMELSGEFVVDSTPKVIIYLGSFNISLRRYEGLIAVLVHELFHAFNFFEGGGPRSVREVDEPMVEFAAGVFLKAMSQTNSSFDAVYTWHKKKVSSKITGVGEIACYGFGRYLMDNVATKSTFSEDQWIESYARVSAFIDPTLSTVNVIRKALYPFYPTESELKIFKLFEALIFPISAKKKGVSAVAGPSSVRATSPSAKSKKVYEIIDKTTSFVLDTETSMRQVALFIFRDYCSKNPGLTLAGLQSLFSHIYPYYISRNKHMSIVEEVGKVRAYYASEKDSSRYFDNNPIKLPATGETILVTTQWINKNFRVFLKVADGLGYIVKEIFV